MRKLLTNFVVPGIAQPIKSGTLDHLQLAYQEALTALGRSQIGKDYDPTKVYVLYGCVNSDTAPNYDISAGAVFFNGEVYLVDATVFVAADTAVGTVTVSYFASAIADPVTFTDGIAHNVHEIKKMVIADAASGSGDADFEDWVRDEWVVSTSTAGATVTISLGTATITSLRLVYSKQKNTVILNYEVVINITGSSTFGAVVRVPLPLPSIESATKLWRSAAEYIDADVPSIYNGARGTVNQGFTDNDKLEIETKKDAVLGGAVFYGQIAYEI